MVRFNRISKMNHKYQFSSESVGEGHPDKVADYISDSVLDACLEQDPLSRVACETLVKSNCVFVAGEITTKADLNIEKVVRNAIREIGYIDAQDDDVFNADTVFVHNIITKQSPDIKMGVDSDGKEQGAGDQGIMFGYATNETPEFMPAPVMFAHRLLRRLHDLRHAGKVAWLRPDCKSQVALSYEKGKVVHIDNVVISTQHTADVDQTEIRRFCIEEVIRKELPVELLSDKTQYLINPTGQFIVGGPHGDAGLTGRKIIVDTYGGMARHGGGAFSGKDPSKVDRSAAYMCRWVAKNIVAAGLADRVELQVAYAIGYPHPTSVFVETFGTHKVPETAIRAAVEKVFSFKPADIVKQLGLLKPIYRRTTNYGHFTKEDLPWEKTDKVEALKAAING